jgi:hypothetical protein
MIKIMISPRYYHVSVNSFHVSISTSMSSFWSISLPMNLTLKISQRHQIIWHSFTTHLSFHMRIIHHRWNIRICRSCLFRELNTPIVMSTDHDMPSECNLIVYLYEYVHVQVPQRFSHTYKYQCFYISNSFKPKFYANSILMLID